MAKQLDQEKLFINNDTQEQVNKYLDNICSDPKFLCNNKELCGTSTSIYTSVSNVKNICENIKKANKCENDFKECVVLTTNLMDDSQEAISTSFVNIIIPIANELDAAGNQKFLRMPALSSSKNANSKDICSICECMNRFALSPGAGNNNNNISNTSPGQNQCMYPTTFEFFYYPIDIENINNIIPKTVPVTLGKYTVINSNIIYASSEESLAVGNLYDLLIKNGISNLNTINFINKLYQNSKTKELNLYILNKTKKLVSQNNKKKFYENITFYYVIFIIFIILIFFFLIKFIV
jgi:hypothetical protein